MYYTIYKITNLLNDKVYIGKHQTNNLDDVYMGSGKNIKRAIDKYGKENFKREILFVFYNESDMNSKEAELVTEEFVSRKDTYNICPGGKGGWGYVNKFILTEEDRSMRGKIGGFSKFTKEDHSKYGKLGMKRLRERIASGELIIPKSKRPSPNKGKNLTEEHRRKIGESNKEAQKGKANSQYGIRFKWMNNGLQNKKVLLDFVNDYTSDGWKFGRISRK